MRDVRRSAAPAGDGEAVGHQRSTTSAPRHVPNGRRTGLPGAVRRSRHPPPQGLEARRADEPRESDPVGGRPAAGSRPGSRQPTRPTPTSRALRQRGRSGPGDRPLRRRLGFLDRPPDPLAVHGMSMCLTPRCETASTTAFWMAGVDPMVPDSPMPLAPSGLRGLSVWVLDDLEARQLGRRRDRVVGEVRRDRVAVARRRRPHSNSACAAPWAMPPCCWPATSSGLRMRPQSSTATWRSSCDLAGLGVDLDDGDVRAERDTSSRCRRSRARGAAPPAPCPSGSFDASSDAAARSAHDTPRAGTPATWSPPSPTTMSSTSASSRWAAICLALLEHLVRRDVHRRSGRLQRPRAHRAGAARDGRRCRS